MGTMVLQLDPLSQSSPAVPFGVRRRQGKATEQGDANTSTVALREDQHLRQLYIITDSSSANAPAKAGASILPISPTVNSQRAKATSISNSMTASRGHHASASVSTPPTGTQPTPPSRGSKSSGCFPQDSISVPEEASISAASDTHHFSCGAFLKRRRPLNDVDGPNSASLSCKKRRLRLHLITSRLSQPFSLPASHILNREAAAVGDKRFLKLATIMATRKLITSVASLSISSPTQRGALNHPVQHHQSQSAMLRRAAAINRIRLRAREASVQRGDASVVEGALNGSLLTQRNASLHDLGFATNARMPNTSISHQLPQVQLSTMPPSIPGLQSVHPMASHSSNLHPHSLPRTETVPRAFSPASPSVVAPHTSSPDLPARLLSPSKRSRPQLSPELRATLSPSRYGMALLEGDPDDGEGDMAFPTIQHERRYDIADDIEDVYADFSLIFGHSHTDPEENSDEDDHYEGLGFSGDDVLEDVLDDLDGIPVDAR